MKERAGIYLSERAQEVFYSLPEASQQRLAEFLDGQRAEFDRAGGRKEGCASEWEPGWAVYWDINLKPQYRKLAAVESSGRLGKQLSDRGPRDQAPSLT